MIIQKSRGEVQFCRFLKSVPISRSSVRELDVEERQMLLDQFADILQRHAGTAYLAHLNLGVARNQGYTIRVGWSSEGPPAAYEREIRCCLQFLQSFWVGKL